MSQKREKLPKLPVLTMQRKSKKFATNIGVTRIFSGRAIFFLENFDDPTKNVL